MQIVPGVSVGLPVYNGERYLAAAVDTILGQTFEDFELIIADNASTDGTAAIARDFAKRDARVRYVRNATNIGAIANFNLVFKLARGEYFKWNGYDDMLPHCSHTPLPYIPGRAALNAVRAISNDGLAN